MEDENKRKEKEIKVLKKKCDAQEKEWRGKFEEIAKKLIVFVKKLFYGVF